MKKLILAGATDQTIDIFIQDSASTTGAGKTGLAYNTASLTCYYRKGATGSATALTLATQTVGGAHSDGGFVEIDATNMPGMYRLDLSDTIVNTAGSVTLLLKGASGMVPLPIELQVVAFNPEDAVRLGLSALPNAAAGANGGLPTGNGSGQVTVAGTATGAITASSFAAGAIDNAAIAADAIGSSELAASAITEIQSGLSTLDAAGVRTAVGLASANLDTQLGSLATAASLSTVAGYIDTEVAAIKAKTDNLPTDPADASDIASSFSTVNSTLATLSAYVDTEVAAIKAKTDQLTFTTAGRVDSQVFGMEAGTVTAAAIATGAVDADAIAADAVAEIQSGLSTLAAADVRTAVGLASANLDTQLGTLATAANLATVAGYIDTEVAAIKAKTDNLPASPAAAGDSMALTAAAVDAILDEVVEGSYTLRQLLRGFAAAMLGKASGLATTTAVYRDTGDTKARITATVDTDGNRSSVTLDLT